MSQLIFNFTSISCIFVIIKSVENVCDLKVKVNILSECNLLTWESADIPRNWVYIFTLSIQPRTFIGFFLVKLFLFIVSKIITYVIYFVKILFHSEGTVSELLQVIKT